MELQYVIFELAGQDYGINISSVQEIIRIESITKLPGAPDFVEGIINLRGTGIPILDLRKRLGLPLAEGVASNRIVVVEINDATVGFIIDQVLEVIHISEQAIKPPPPVISGEAAAYLQGIALLGERMVVILSVDKLIGLSEAQELKGVV